MMHLIKFTWSWWKRNAESFSLIFFSQIKWHFVHNEGKVNVNHIKSFFANNYCGLKDREIVLTPSCSSLHNESKYVCGDLKKPISKLDLRSMSRDDPNMSCCISVDAPWRDKHVGTIFTPLMMIRMTSIKTYWQKTVHDLWWRHMTIQVSTGGTLCVDWQISPRMPQFWINMTVLMRVFWKWSTRIPPIYLIQWT